MMRISGKSRFLRGLTAMGPAHHMYPSTVGAPKAAAQEWRAHIAAAWLLLVGLLGAAACDFPLQPVTVTPADSPFVVSNPRPSLAPTDARGPVVASAVASATDIVYVALPSGTIPNAERATIRARSSANTVTAKFVDGGLDPVPVAAGVGDTLDVEVRVSGSSIPLQYRLIVPTAARPIVVRTYPPPRKRDVPLNAALLIVFSEPIEVATVNASSVQVRSGAIPVPGQLAFGTAPHLTATFTPDTPLIAATDYELVITQGIRDLDGQSLDAPLTILFATVAQTVAPQISGTIAFTRIVIRPGSTPNWSSDVMWYRDGNESRRVVSDVSLPVEEPSWSPDGVRLAVDLVYGSMQDGSGAPEFASDIFLLPAESTGGISMWRRLTTDGLSRSPDWSPDGQRIVFVSGRPSRSHIYVVDTAGGNPVRLTATEGHYGMPSWSPDGRRLAFTEERDGNTDIFVMNSDGTGAVNVSVHPAHDYSPSWSPDGKHLAFDSERNGPFSDIFTVDADGGNLKRLTQSTYGSWNGGPVWSPDGRQIAYSLVTYVNGWNPDGRSGIYVMNADGSQQTRLTEPPVGAGDTSPAWRR